MEITELSRTGQVEEAVLQPLRKAAGFAAVSISWAVQRPILGIAWLIRLCGRRISAYKANNARISEHTKCPACGYKGCRVNFVPTQGAERAAIRQDCLMCGAFWHVHTLVPAERWVAIQPQQRVISQRRG